MAMATVTTAAESSQLNLSAIPPAVGSDILPPFRLGTRVARLCREFRTLLTVTFRLAKQTFDQRTQPDSATPYNGSLYDAYEEALVELAKRCHREGQLGFMVAMLVDDMNTSHFLRPYTGGFDPLSSLRLWTTLDMLWGRPFSLTRSDTKKALARAAAAACHDDDDNDKAATQKGAAIQHFLGKMLERDTNMANGHTSTEVERLISQRRRDTLLHCILSDNDDDEDDDDDVTRDETEATARPTTGTISLPGMAVAKSKPKPKSKAKAKAIVSAATATTNDARAHFCVNCGAHTKGWPRSWKHDDPLLQVVWCRTCYQPHIVTRSALTRHYEVNTAALDTLPGVYTHSRASPLMVCYPFEQALRGVPTKQRLRSRPGLFRVVPSAPPPPPRPVASKRRIPSDGDDSDSVSSSTRKSHKVDNDDDDSDSDISHDVELTI